jgi:LysM repeat protein
VVRKIVDDYNAVNIDADLTILEVTNKIDATGMRTVGMVVATVDRWNDTDDSVIISRMEETRVMESYPQMNANSYVTSYMDYMDDTYDAKFDFWLGAEVLNVNQVMFRFTMESLRSTVKSVAGQSTTSSSGGGATITSNSGGSSTPTSSSGGATTSSSGGEAHHHNVYIVSSSAGAAVKYDDEIGLTVVGGGEVSSLSANLGHTHTVGNHTHSVSIAAHTHNVSVAAHTHTLTPNISTEYGIYEEPNPAEKKLRQTDLTFDINGTNIPNTAAVPVDGWAGWWELDLTPYVSDVNTFRPLRTVNRLTLGAAASGVGRKAQISGQLVVRTVIRAVAVV